MAGVNLETSSVGGFPMMMGGYGYGGGCHDSYGLGGGGVLGGLILGSLISRRGLFGDGEGCCHGHNSNWGGPTAYQMGVNAGENATKEDIFGLANTVNIGADRAVNASRETGNAIQAQLYAMNTGINAGFTSVEKGLCSVENKIGESMYANALLAKDAAAAMCAMEHRLSTQAACDTQKILDRMCQDREAALMMKLNETQRERDLLATGNFPIAQNASLVKQRCHDGGDVNIAIGNSINTMNDSLNKMNGLLFNLLGNMNTAASQRN